jgi:hypothetical protein
LKLTQFEPIPTLTQKVQYLISGKKLMPNKVASHQSFHAKNNNKRWLNIQSTMKSRGIETKRLQTG